MFYIDVMKIHKKTIKTLSTDLLEPVTGLNYARHHSLSLSTTPHRHAFMEIFLVTDGAIRHEVEGVEEFLEAGVARLIRPNDAHRFRRVEARSCELFNIAFSVPFFQDAGKTLDASTRFDALLDASSPPGLFIPDEELVGMSRRLDRIGLDLASETEKAAIRAKALLVEFFAAFAGESSSAGTPIRVDMPEWMADVCSILKSERLFLKGVSELLRLSGRSHEHVCREFVKVMEMTPTDYVNDLRLKHAEALLTGTDDKIHSIAMDSGFDSLSHFHHLFKKKFGVSPARRRRSIRRSAIPG